MCGNPILLKMNHEIKTVLISQSYTRCEIDLNSAKHVRS